MAKAASTSLVLPIIFLVILALVEQNMGCTASMGPCEICTSCRAKCTVKFGAKVNYFCDRSSGGVGGCVCVYPCIEQKSGCTASMGRCEMCKSCRAKCLVSFGGNATHYCDPTTGGAGECVCVYPCGEHHP